MTRVLRTLAFLGFGLILSLSACGQLLGLEQGFAAPPDNTKLWVYWYWISDNITKEGITADLEAMARVGIGEALIGNIFLDDVRAGNVIRCYCARAPQRSPAMSYAPRQQPSAQRAPASPSEPGVARCPNRDINCVVQNIVPRLILSQALCEVPPYLVFGSGRMIICDSIEPATFGFRGRRSWPEKMEMHA